MGRLSSEEVSVNTELVTLVSDEETEVAVGNDNWDDRLEKSGSVSCCCLVMRFKSLSRLVS